MPGNPNLPKLEMITLEIANRIIAAAIAKARELKIRPMAFAVLDGGAHSTVQDYPGRIGYWDALKERAELRAKYGALDPKQTLFVWSDLNGNGAEDPDEVQTTTSRPGLDRASWVAGEDLAILTEGYRLRPKSFTSAAVPAPQAVTASEPSTCDSATPEAVSAAASRSVVGPSTGSTRKGPLGRPQRQAVSARVKRRGG